MINSAVAFNIAILLALVSVIWADIHFLLAVVRAGHWWDIIPLAGMLILSYGIGWLIRKISAVRDQLQELAFAMANIATVFQIGRYHPQGEKFIRRMVQPPETFERDFRASLNRGDQW